MSIVVTIFGSGLFRRALGLREYAVHATKTALTFAFVFNLSFSAAPSISSGRVALGVLLLIYWRATIAAFGRFVRENSYTTCTFALLILYALLIYTLDGAKDSTMLSRATWFFVLVIGGASAYGSMCSWRIYDAALYYMLAALLQAVFVFQSIVDPSFREWVGSTLVRGGNIEFDSAIRFSGLSNGAGALLSTQIGLGAWAAIIVFLKSRSNSTRAFAFLALSAIVASTVFVGRTGLYVGLGGCIAALYFVFRSHSLGTMLFAGLPTLGSVIVGVEILNVIELSVLDIDRIAKWAFDLFLYGQSNSASALIDDLNRVPDLDLLTALIGSGRIVSFDGSNYSGHDSGYLHLIFATGIPMSILFYSSLLLLYLKHIRRMRDLNLKAVSIILACLVFILEFKEPFIFKYTLPFFALVVCTFGEIERTSRTGRSPA